MIPLLLIVLISVFETNNRVKGAKYPGLLALAEVAGVLFGLWLSHVIIRAAMDIKSLSNEEGIDRRQALSLMWEKFYEENRAFIERLSNDSEDYRTQLFAVFFADMVVQNMPKFQWFYDAMRKARTTPIPARVWFNEQKGICRDLRTRYERTPG